jgi:hypothetical protein
MPITMPLATDAVREAQKIADSMVDDFRKYKDPHDPAPEAMTEQHVLASIAIFYYERPNGSKKFDNTIGAALIDSEDAMSYMGFPEAILQRLKSNLFWGKGTEVWRKAHNEWAFSWDNDRDDD